MNKKLVLKLAVKTYIKQPTCKGPVNTSAERQNKLDKTFMIFQIFFVLLEKFLIRLLLVSIQKVT